MAPSRPYRCGLHLRPSLGPPVALPQTQTLTSDSESSAGHTRKGLGAVRLGGWTLCGPDADDVPSSVERSWCPQDTWDLRQDSGTAHVVVVSCPSFGHTLLSETSRSFTCVTFTGDPPLHGCPMSSHE